MIPQRYILSLILHAARGWMPLYSMSISISYLSPRSHCALVGFFATLQYKVRTAFSMPEHHIGGPPIPNNSLSFRLPSTGSGIGKPLISLEATFTRVSAATLEARASRLEPVDWRQLFWRLLSLGQLKALLCHVSLTSYFYNLCYIQCIGRPPIPYHEGSTTHFVLLGTSLFNVYLLYSFYVPLGIGDLPIPSAKSMQSCSLEVVIHQFSTSTYMRLAWMVIVSVGRRYDPQGLGGLGTRDHGKRGGKNLLGISRPPIPPAISHIFTELVSAVRQYQCF